MLLLGDNNLRTVSKDVVQNILNNQKTVGGNRHLVRAFRALFKFIGRHDDASDLRRKKVQQQYKPPYLTVEQVQILTNVPEDWSERFPHLGDLITIIFNLGVRISESLAIEKADVKKSNDQVVVRIERQWVRKESANANHKRLRPTKNKNIRNVLPINTKETLEALERWLKAYPTHEERERYRYAIDRYIRETCRKKFAIKVEESIEESAGFFDLDKLRDVESDRTYKATHMLRAAHAIHMMAVVKDEVFVANQLGDTVEVVRAHYVGRTNKAISISEASKLLKEK